MKRILIVAPAWVGDMVMSQVIYTGLRRKYAGAGSLLIDVLAPAATLPLVQRMAEVDRGILLDQRHGQAGFGYRMRLGRRLAENGYEQAIVIPNSMKSALTPFFAQIPQRTGFLGEYRYFLLNDVRLLDKKRLPAMTDRLLALTDLGREALEPPRLLIDEENRARFLAEHGLATDRPVTGLCPGAEFGDAKKWPEAHYAALAQSLTAAGRHVWLFGSPADAATGAAIAAGVGAGCTNLAGKTSLLDAVDLLSLCDRVVTNDSGLMHIAAAVGARVVAIYGSTSPEFTPPLADAAALVRLGLDCSPCFRRECPLGHKNCLVQLTPDQVLGSLRTL